MKKDLHIDVAEAGFEEVVRRLNQQYDAAGYGGPPWANVHVYVNNDADAYRLDGIYQFTGGDSYFHIHEAKYEEEPTFEAAHTEAESDGLVITGEQSLGYFETMAAEE